MATNALPPAEVLRKLLDYDPDTGVLIWRKRTAEFFTDGRVSALTQSRRWNTRHAGQRAFTIIVRGHNVGSIGGKRFYAHRIIWKIVTGEEPNEIDHINGVKSDNRWVNLRNVTRSINMRNRKLSPANTSGVNGVHWHAQRGKWNARIKVVGVTKSLGLFQTLGEAAEARRRAEAAHGFTARHGRC